MQEKYNSQAYWDERYRSGHNHTWYYEYADIRPLLDEVVRPEHCVLELGCGDAPLLTDMAECYSAEHTAKDQEERGCEYGQLIAVDYSASVVAALEAGRGALKLTPQLSQHLEFLCLDARDMRSRFPSSGGAEGTVDVVIDKGTTDALLCGGDQQGFRDVSAMLREALRCCRADCAYALISHMQIDSEQFEDVLDSVVFPLLGECLYAI